MAMEKLQCSILLTNVGNNEMDWRKSKSINVYRIVAVSRISRTRKLLENVAVPLKKNGLVIAPGEISNIQ